MNSEDRKRLRKQKHRIMMMRLWLPVVLVVVLVVGLTAGGIAMSLGQTKSVAEQGTKEDGTKNVETKEASNESKEAGDENGEAQTVDQAGADKQQSEEAQTGAESDNSQAGNEDYDSNHAIEQSDFDEFITNLNEAVAQNSNYLKRESENLTRTLAELQTYDRTHLTEAQAKTYDALLDALNVEMDGEQYDSVAAAAADAALCSVEGGVDYYNYLLQKYSGVDGAWGDFREILANEANGNYQVMNDLMGGDSTLQVGAASFTKQAPDDAYAYDTVSASSSALKKNLVCNGFVNGWTEFGIIRAYLNDDRLDDNLRNYLIASTRMTYALYGVADISVHAGGWGEAEVTDLCTTYFGEAGGSSYGSSVYQMVLKNPGKYAAAVRWSAWLILLWGNSCVCRYGRRFFLPGWQLAVRLTFWYGYNIMFTESPHRVLPVFIPADPVLRQLGGRHEKAGKSMDLHLGRSNAPVRASDCERAAFPVRRHSPDHCPRRG